MIQKHLLGAMGVALIVLGGSLMIWPPEDGYQQAASMCLRIGIVLGAVWLAFPALSRVRPMTYAMVLCGALIVAAYPKAILAVLPTMFFAWLLRPRGLRSKPERKPNQPE